MPTLPNQSGDAAIKKGKTPDIHARPQTGLRRESIADESAEQLGAVLSKQECEEILKKSVKEIESNLKEKFQLDTETDLKSAAILDYYVGATYWAKQQQFGWKQLSVFFTASHNLLNKIRDEQVSIAELLQELKSILAQIGPCEGGLHIFNMKQAKAIMDYLSNSLLQHYKLYLYLFSMPQRQEIVTMEVPLETPFSSLAPFPFSLCEGIPEEIITASMNPLEVSCTKVSPDKEMDSEIDLLATPEIFAKLTTEDVKQIIDETCSSFLENLQEKLESKLKVHENATLEKINKITSASPTKSLGIMGASAAKSPGTVIR